MKDALHRERFGSTSGNSAGPVPASSAPVSPSMSDVRNNKALNRFELDADGEIAVAYYRAGPGTLTFTHTEVPAHLNGRGIGSRLVRGALEAARADGLQVIPRCSFVAAFIARHSEFSDLLA